MLRSKLNKKGGSNEKTNDNLYRSLVENYDYNMMYDPIKIDNDNKKGNKKGNNGVSTKEMDDMYNQAVDFDYTTRYIPPIPTKPTKPQSQLQQSQPQQSQLQQINNDELEQTYNDRMIDYDYNNNDDQEYDPDEQLRKAEDTIELLQTQLKEVVSESQILVVKLKEMHDKLNQTADELESDIMSDNNILKKLLVEKSKQIEQFMNENDMLRSKIKQSNYSDSYSTYKYNKSKNSPSITPPMSPYLFIKNKKNSKE